MDPQTVALLDKVIVTLLGIILVGFIYWFFLRKKEEAKKETNIIVDGGYKPSVIKLTAGEETKLTFLRKDANSCLEEIVIPDFKIQEFLPLNTPVTINITPPHKGEYDIHCGMNMYHGKVIAV